MFAAGKHAVQVQVWRLAFLSVGLVPIALTIILSAFWLRDHVPIWVYWQAALIFLTALKFVYWIVGVLASVGLGVLGFLLFRGLRPRSRPLVARGLLLCVSLILGMIAAETASTIWLYRSHQRTALPIGGRRDDTPFARSSLEARAPRDIPLPTTFAQTKADGEINLVILGESSAEGVPYNFWVSIGAMIGWQLKEAIPSRSVHIETLASSGETLEIQHKKLGALKRRPDLMIIYCGHNEFSARWSSSRDVDYYFDSRLPTVWSILVDRIEDVSAVTTLIDESVEKCQTAIPPPIGGHRACVDVPVYTSSDYSTLLIDFRRRLNTIVAYAVSIGALPILILPPANDAGFEPNRSFLPASTPRHEREAFRRDFLAARELEASDPGRSLERYRALLNRQPEFAETHYRIARLLECDAAWDEAYEHYIRARDLDGFPMRLPSAFQHAYREVAARYNCILIDGQSYFHEIGRHGLLDENLFHDAMHPSLRGQIALAQAILQALHEVRAFGWPTDSPAPVIDPARCAGQFGLVPAVWRRICLWGIMFYDATSGARYDSSYRLHKKVVFAAAANRIEAGEAPESVGLPNIGMPAPIPVVARPVSERLPHELSGKRN
jgi:hypothetical protein